MIHEPFSHPLTLFDRRAPQKLGVNHNCPNYIDVCVCVCFLAHLFFCDTSKIQNGVPLEIVPFIFFSILNFWGWFILNHAEVPTKWGELENQSAYICLNQ